MMRQTERLKAVGFAVASLVLMALIYNNCDPALMPPADTGSSSQQSRYEVDPFPESDDNPSPSDNSAFDPDQNEESTNQENKTAAPSSDTQVDDKGVTIGPKTLSTINGSINLNAPATCVPICLQQYECNTDTGCSQTCAQTCLPFIVRRDPYVLTSFTIPAGYKKAVVKLEHCTDRRDVLVMDGPSLQFKSQPLSPLDLGGLAFRSLAITPSPVSRGYSCVRLRLHNHARVAIEFTDSNGKSAGIKDYIWKAPDVLPFKFSMIKDLDPGQPVFARFSSVSGPGAKIIKVYDNYGYMGQLSFLVEYYNWYSRRFTTVFELWYKPASSP